ncbi:putative LRR receptor-like serine/threonine-protein kinase [Planoprotostelium fungivorum]|uniref:Putative LRR receptor-like serine/threonine-protein kinase n=1 Tax=Planoprotostelium fungivorum TaxID=1890364 RepID=A0A2P6N4E9_9EUKA|nr:putative LRR receptor-like serine/threonine-protein kinase [Planoprotostelium fungivorum]
MKAYVQVSVILLSSIFFHGLGDLSAVQAALTGSDFPPWNCSTTINNVFKVVVSCSDGVSVSSLVLSNFKRPIPPDIGKLLNLTFLTLNNGFSGGIPERIYNLTQLTHLDLGNNALNGTISNQIGALRNLATLNLGTNQLVGRVPLELGNLTNLRYLYLDNNIFSGEFPGVLSHMSQLVELTLYVNHFYGIFPPGQRLNRLVKFDVHSNRFGGDLSNMLTYFNSSVIGFISVTNNSMSGTIPDFSNFESLTHFSLKSNQFSAVQNPQFPKNLNTTTCDLSDNSIPCLPYVKVTNCQFQCKTCDQIRCNVTTNGQLFNQDLTLSAAQSLLDQISAGNEPKTSLPGILTALIEDVLHNNTSLELHSTDIDAVVMSYVHPMEDIELHLTDSQFVRFPLSVVKNVSGFAVSVSKFKFNPFAEDNDQKTYGGVMGVSFYNGAQLMKINSTRETINISMGSIPSLPENSNLYCLWWKENGSTWERQGCNLTIIGSFAVCHCYHLTNFTLGADAVPPPTQRDNSRLIVIIVCCVGGVIFLSLTVTAVVFVMRKRMAKPAETSFDLNCTKGELIHRGEDTEIWSAAQSDTNQVAIKISLSDSASKRLILEMETLKYLGEQRGHRVEMVMTFLPFSLDQLMKRRNASTQYILQTSFEVTKAMSYVSNQNLVHTRLTADHILVDLRDGVDVVKVTGFSHSVKNDTRIDLSTVHSHTAPEVVKTMTQNLEADVYTFGLLLRHLLTLSPLYEGLSHLQLVDKLRTEVQVTVEESWDPQLREMIESCTSQYPKQRPSFTDISKTIAKCIGREMPTREQVMRDDNVYVEV